MEAMLKALMMASRGSALRLLARLGQQADSAFQLRRSLLLRMYHLKHLWLMCGSLFITKLIALVQLR